MSFPRFEKLGRGHVWGGQIDPCITQNHVPMPSTGGLTLDISGVWAQDSYKLNSKLLICHEAFSPYSSFFKKPPAALWLK
jgi:hypothetical protein